MSLKKIISLVILVVAVISFALYYKVATSDDADATIDTLLNITKVMLILAAALAIIGLILDVFSDKKALKYTLMALVGFAVIIFIAYSMASGHPYKLGDTVYSASTSTWVDTGLWTFYLLAIIALILMFFTWISDFFKTS